MNAMSAPQKPGDLFNPDLELALIGMALVDPEAYRLARELVSAEDFFDPVLGRIWAKMAAEIEANRHLVPAVLAEAFRGDEGFDAIGGFDMLSNAFVAAPPTFQAPEHARIVADLAVRRRVVEAARVAIQAARKPDVTGAQVAGELRREAEHIEQGSAPDDDLFVDAHRAGADRLAKLETELAAGRPRGVRCGLSCVDRRLGGLLPGSLVVVAARPGLGKTALLGNILFGAAKLNPNRLFAGFSLEMDNDQLMDRALSRLSADDDEPIPYERLSKGLAVPSDLDRLHALRAYLPHNLLLRDRAGLSVESVARAVWWLRRKGDLAAVGIDYLQIMRRPKAEGRNEASVIGEMTTALKTLAREAGVTIILLSQLSRAVEARDDKRPQLGDLRESGAIEQDADAVLFPFREAYYLAKAEPKPGDPEHLEWEMRLADVRRRMDVHVAKNRHGGEGIERQLYDAEFDRIENEPEGRR